MKLKYWSLIVNILPICGFILIIECISEFHKENDWHQNWHYIHHFQQLLNSSEPKEPITKNSRRTAIRPTATVGPDSLADILMVDPDDPSQHPQPPLIFTSGNNPPEPVFGHIDHTKDDIVINWSNNRLNLKRPSEPGAPQSNRQPPFFAKVEDSRLRPRTPFISITVSNITIIKTTNPSKGSNTSENPRKVSETTTKVRDITVRSPEKSGKKSESGLKLSEKLIKAPENSVNVTKNSIKEQEYQLKVQGHSTKKPKDALKPARLPQLTLHLPQIPLMHVRVPLINVKWPVMPNKGWVGSTGKPVKMADKMDQGKEKPNKVAQKPSKVSDSMPVLEPQPLPPSTKPLEERKDCVVLGRAGSCFPFFPFGNVFDCFLKGGIVAMDIVRCSWVRACCVPNMFR